jgi:hypothetical protein
MMNTIAFDRLMSCCRFTLLQLHIGALLVCFLSAAIRLSGFAPIVLGIASVLGFYTLVSLWGLVYLRAPEATKYATVCGFFGVMLLSLLALYVVRSREEARRNQCIHQLRRIGQQASLEREFNETNGLADLESTFLNAVFTNPQHQSSVTAYP